MNRTVVFFMLLFLSGCSCEKKKGKPELLVINVLDAELFNDCHIKGSINVSFEQLEDFAKKLDKDTQIVIYCSNYQCTASFLGARMLKQMGFKNIWAYEAGMAGGFQSGLSLEGMCKQPYLTMKNVPLDMEKESDIEIITTQDLQNKLMQTLTSAKAVACGY